MNPVAIQTILKAIAGMKQTIGQIEQLLQTTAAYPAPAQHVQPQQQFQPQPQQHLSQQQGVYQGVHPGVYQQPQQFQQQPAFHAVQQPAPRVVETGYLSEHEEHQLGSAMAMGLQGYPGEFVPDQNDPRADQLRASFAREMAGAQPQSGVASYLRSGGIYGQ